MTYYIKKMERTKMSLKKYLFILFTKIIKSNPYFLLIILKITYVVIPERILEKHLPF